LRKDTTFKKVSKFVPKKFYAVNSRLPFKN
jgi:hypothetical protein